MSQIEIGFKIVENKNIAEKILLKNGFTNLFKTVTRDIYFGKNDNFDEMDETQIKTSLIRCRNLKSLENLKVFDKSLPDKIKLDKETKKEWLVRLKNAGYKVVFDTKKTDWVYQKGNIDHQLQDIKHIGLLDYVYAKFDEDYTEEEMFDILTKHMQDLGLHLEYELGVDKLRSLHAKKLQFSKNQIGLYDYQK